MESILENLIEKSYKFAKERNLKIYYITANGQVDSYPKVYPNLFQWLELIDNADYVITNSFHGCVFSIIFHKQFVAIPITGAAFGMNERLSSLFELCHMEPRLIENCDTTPDFSVLDKEYIASPDVSGGQLLINALKTV